MPHLGEVLEDTEATSIRVTCVECDKKRTYTFHVAREQVSVPACSCGNGTWYEEAIE